MPDPTLTIETVDDVINGVRECLGFSLDWEDWKRDKAAKGWTIFYAKDGQRGPQNEIINTLWLKNSKQRIEAQLNRINFKNSQKFGYTGRCETYSKVANEEAAVEASNKILQTFSIPEFDPPSNSLNLQSGESINFSISYTGKSERGLNYVTVVNARNNPPQ